MSDELKEELRAIHGKLDQLLAIAEELRSAKKAKSEAKKAAKQKLPPLTEEEIKEHQSKFAELFERWMRGDELEVTNELERLDAEQLRRFADSNNLNVTSKMPAQKVLHRIGARFREKRQLRLSTARRPEGGGTPEGE